MNDQLEWYAGEEDFIEGEERTDEDDNSADEPDLEPLPAMTELVF